MKHMLFLALAVTMFGHALAGDAVAVQVRDLRASQWRKSTVQNVGTGVVQYTGDDTKLGSFVDLIATELSQTAGIPPRSIIELKTADVRLSLPDVQIDENAVHAAQNGVPKGAVLAAPIAAIMSAFSKNKSASAVFCVAIDGRNFLGNDARLFRVGAETELKDAVESALSRLSRAIAAGTSTDSVACEPGWEGGQAKSE